jgi:competence protein ComEA
MRTELPAERLHRRLGADPDADADRDGAPEQDPDESDAPEDDQDSLIPRWLPEGSVPGLRGSWMAKMRADPGRAGAVALAVVAALAVLVTVFTLLRDRPPPVVSAKLPPVERASSAAPRPSASPAAGPDRPAVVSVVGLVHKPGLVTLAPGARIADALQAAGGALDGADTVGLNMARPVGDGEQIVVGLAPPAGQPRTLGSSVTSGPVAAPGSGSEKPKAGTKPGAPLDLNTATVEQLDALPGVGPVTAAAIVAWRQANGKFTSIDQLGEVDGIGPSRLDKLRALVRV